MRHHSPFAVPLLLPLPCYLSSHSSSSSLSLSLSLSLFVFSLGCFLPPGPPSSRSMTVDVRVFRWRRTRRARSLFRAGRWRRLRESATGHAPGSIVDQCKGERKCPFGHRRTVQPGGFCIGTIATLNLARGAAQRVTRPSSRGDTSAAQRSRCRSFSFSKKNADTPSTESL